MEMNKEYARVATYQTNGFMNKKAKALGYYQPEEETLDLRPDPSVTT